MITRIREVRKAKRMTLDDVARACKPPTTPQTVGRLETGMRTVSIGWLNRIADALGVSPTDLVDHPESEKLEVLALLGSDGASAPRKAQVALPPRPAPAQVAILVTSSIGDYRNGDELWCDRIQAEEFGRAINRDILVPRPTGRFQFGRLLAREDGKLHLLPLGSGARQVVINDPPYVALPVKLVRSFG
ncbi:helix-turn-helix transcriptional regulator [Sphingomonas sp. LHG3406-1]|uniref:helix-turn-helix domain-containing protein n=1 Tax=Sphingomonas sp. LHG3406-1 TaxID=2804617 RepID=UPI002634D151|nr:helix-turn-helix transcriptional regulator [Sphingomonas sp. LHG3406-1]